MPANSIIIMIIFIIIIITSSWKVPPGWELVPGEADMVRDVVAKHSWASRSLLSSYLSPAAPPASLCLRSPSLSLSCSASPYLYLMVPRDIAAFDLKAAYMMSVQWVQCRSIA